MAGADVAGALAFAGVPSSASVLGAGAGVLLPELAAIVAAGAGVAASGPFAAGAGAPHAAHAIAAARTVDEIVRAPITS
jgi:hypothetical protein